MLLFFVVLWNMLMAYEGIETMGFETWLRVTSLLLMVLSIGAPWEAFLIVRFNRMVDNGIKGLPDLIRKSRKRLRERSRNPDSSGTSDTP